MFGYLALLFLVVAIMQSDQFLLRIFSVISGVLYLVAYCDDVILVLTNCLIIVIHLYHLFKTHRRQLKQFVNKLLTIR